MLPLIVLPLELSPKKVFGQGIPDEHQGPRRQDIADPGPGTSWTKTLCKAPFPVVLDREWPGCHAIRVGTSLELGAHLGQLESLML